jgi:hypothetical protein
MEHYSLAVGFPHRPPFDRPDPQPGNWYDSFLGAIVLPAVQTGQLARYWFSHYGAFGRDHHAKFRFSTDSIADVQAVLDPLIGQYGLQLQQEHGHVFPHPFDIVSDLAHTGGAVTRLGNNRRVSDLRERGELLYSFLHASAALVLHCLSETDQEGRWYREFNPDQGNHHFNDTTESIHHLFCNMSGVPTAVCVMPPPVLGAPPRLMSPLYAKIRGVYQPNLPVVRVPF